MPGLDRLLEHVPPGCVVLVEGGVEEAKDAFARELAKALLAEGRSLTFATAREGIDVTAHLGDGSVHVLPVTSWDDLPRPGSGAATGDLVVDDVGLLGMDASPAVLRSWLEALRAYCRSTHAVAVLVVEDGLLDATRTALLRHIAHGILQFRSREETDAVLTYLVAPKWPAGTGRPEKVFYAHDAGRLVLDTRQRHA